MKRYFLRLLLVFSSSCSIVYGSVDAFHIVYADYPPYSYQQNGRVQGLEVDILTEVLERRMGIAVKHEVLPWSRAQLLVEQGVADAFVAVKTEPRARYAVAGNVPVAYWGVSTFFLSGRVFDFDSVNSPLVLMKEYRVGALLGNGWVKQNMNQHQIHYSSNFASLINMLLQGRLDFLPENRYVMRYFLKNMDVTVQIAEHPISDTDLGMYLHIGRKSAYLPLLEEIDEVLFRLTSKGVLDEITGRYQ